MSMETVQLRFLQFNIRVMETQETTTYIPYHLLKHLIYSAFK